jgi:hypothetical protein
MKRRASSGWDEVTEATNRFTEACAAGSTVSQRVTRTTRTNANRAAAQLA